jgi:hypothetical protein
MGFAVGDLLWLNPMVATTGGDTNQQTATQSGVEAEMREVGRSSTEQYYFFLQWYEMVEAEMEQIGFFILQPALSLFYYYSNLPTCLPTYLPTYLPPYLPLPTPLPPYLPPAGGADPWPELSQPDAGADADADEPAPQGIGGVECVAPR